MVSVRTFVIDECVHKHDITGQVYRSRVMLSESADEGYRSESVQWQGSAG